MMDLSKIDEETLRVMMKYCGKLERKIKCVIVLEEWSTDEWPLVNFDAEYRRALEQISYESRDTAKVELSDYHFSIYYHRLETDEEWNDRLEEALEYAEDRQRLEREQYLKLKSKHEG